MTAVWRRIWVLFAVFLFLFPGVLPAADENPTEVTEALPSGQVNWTKWLVQATGTCGPKGKSFGKPSDRMDAQAKATDLAREGLMKTLLGLRLNAEHLVGDIVRERPVVRSEIADMAKEAPVAKQAYLSDGTVNVTMQLSIAGGFSQLILPEDIEQIDPVKTIARAPKNPDSTEAGTAENKKNVYTGLIVDAAGIELLPAMVTRIFSENGQEVYGTAFVSREFAVQKGMIRYVRDLATARGVPEMNENPLVVKGLRTRTPGNTDIVISNADAARIRGASEHIFFLRQGRVLIATGRPDGE